MGPKVPGISGIDYFVLPVVVVSRDEYPWV
jgi:hypothetical protein